MSNLSIRKKSLNTWLHTDSVFGDFIISKFYFNSFEAKFQIVEEGNTRLEQYLIANITLYDDTDGGVAETFSTITELSLRLEELQYPAFDRSGGVVSISGLIEAGTNVTITGSGTTSDPYVINSSGGGGTTPTFDQVTEQNPLVQFESHHCGIEIFLLRFFHLVIIERLNRTIVELKFIYACPKRLCRKQFESHHCGIEIIGR